MHIHFHPESNRHDYSQAIAEYESIWNRYAELITKTWEEVTGLKFKETEINALIYKGRSQSHPFLLRDEIDLERKTTVLIHELGHRIIFKRQNIPEITSLENHKTLFLVLYEVFEKILGTEIADRAAEWDRENLSADVYKAAWDWALSFPKEERIIEFRKRIVF